MPLQFANTVAKKKLSPLCKNKLLFDGPNHIMFKLRNQAMKYSFNPSSAIHHYKATVK